MKTMTLTNDFHGTSVKVRSDADTMQEAWFEIQAAVLGKSQPTMAAKAHLRRVEKALCGMKDCRCGTVR